MPRKAKSKPITEIPRKTQKSSRKTRQLISEYHALNKKLSQTSDTAERQAISQKLLELGGLDAYQEASLLGQSTQRGGDTSKWLLKYLFKHFDVADTIRLLDVGALRNNYAKLSRISPTCIDLNSQCPAVQAIDFMAMPVPEHLFHVVCLSLVVNFVPSISQRGEMLLRTRSFLQEDGLLFVVLPLACVENSRFMTNEHFLAIALTLGFELLEQHKSAKLAYYLFRKAALRPNVSLTIPKVNLRTGSLRNNFSITLNAQL